MRKHNCKLVRNDRTNLGYIEGPEPVYSWTDYVTREHLPEVPDDKFANIVQVNIDKRFQGGITYTTGLIKTVVTYQ